MLCPSPFVRAPAAAGACTFVRGEGAEVIVADCGTGQHETLATSGPPS